MTIYSRPAVAFICLLLGWQTTRAAECSPTSDLVGHVKEIIYSYTDVLGYVYQFELEETPALRIVIRPDGLEQGLASVVLAGKPMHATLRVHCGATPGIADAIELVD